MGCGAIMVEFPHPIEEDIHKYRSRRTKPRSSWSAIDARLSISL